MIVTQPAHRVLASHLYPMLQKQPDSKHSRVGPCAPRIPPLSLSVRQHTGVIRTSGEISPHLLPPLLLLLLLFLCCRRSLLPLPGVLHQLLPSAQHPRALKSPKSPKQPDWSLSYISYPLLLLAKSCKLVPVMLVGVVMLGRRHTRAEYLAVALITTGVALFSIKPEAFKEGSAEAAGGTNNLLGLALVRERAGGGRGRGRQERMGVGVKRNRWHTGLRDIRRYSRVFDGSAVRHSSDTPSERVE